MDAGNVVLLLLGLITVGAAILGVFHMVGRQHQRIEREWTKAARAVGGRVDIPSGFWAGTAYGMRANLEGTEVVVKLLGAQGPTETRISATTTQLRAPVPEAGDLHLSIRRGRVSSVGRALGTKDVEIGEPAFDELFVVTTNDESGARSWLTPEVRAQLSRAHSYSFSLFYSSTLSHADAGAARSGIEKDSTALEAAIRAVAALASRGRGMEERTEPPTAPSQARMPPASLSAMRIQSIAMMVGVVMLLGLAALLRGKPAAGRGGLTMIAVACAFAASVLACSLRGGLTWQSERDLPGQDWQAFRRRHLASFGVLLAAVLVCAIAVRQTGRSEPLYAAALPLATMLLNLPRRHEV